MSAVFYGTCQLEAVRAILSQYPEFPEKYPKTLYRENYKFDIPLDEEFLSRLRAADLFVYQAVSDKYGEFSDHRLLKELKPECRRIEVVFFLTVGCGPLIHRGGGRIVGSEIILHLQQQGHTEEQILDMFVKRTIDFELKKRVNHCFDIMAQKEEKMEVKITPFCRDLLPKAKIASIHAHPTNVILFEMARQVAALLGLTKECTLSLETPEFLSAEINNPVSSYEIEALGLQYCKAAPEADAFYLDLILQVLHPERNIYLPKADL